MSQTNGHIPPPGDFEQIRACGETWKLSHVGPGIRRTFSAWVVEDAQARLEDKRASLKPVIYARLNRRLEDDILAGAYDWGFPLDPTAMGSAIARALAEGEGPARLLQLLLREHHGEVPLEKIGAAFKDKEKAEEFQATIRRCLDPNSVSPLHAPAVETGPTSGTPTTTAA